MKNYIIVVLLFIISLNSFSQSSSCSPVSTLTILASSSSSSSFCNNEQIEISQTSFTSFDSLEWYLNGDLKHSSTNINDVNYFYQALNTTNSNITDSIIINVFDDHQCSADTVVLTIYPKPTISISHQNLSCNSGDLGPQGSTTGELYIESTSPIQSTSYVGGSYTSFQLIPNTPPSNNVTIENLIAANYQVFITDMNSCNSDTISETITQPDSLHIDVFSLTDDNCGQGTGSVQFHTSGGTMPYTYNLTDVVGNNITTQDSIIHELEGSQNGAIYNYSITDNNECSVQPTSSPSQISIYQHNNNKPLSPTYDSPITYCLGDEVKLEEHESTNLSKPHFYYFDNLSDTTYIPGGNFVVSPSQLASYNSIYIFALGDIGSLNEGCKSDSVLVLFEQKNCSEIQTEDIITNSFSPNDPLHPDNNSFIIDLNHINNSNITDAKVTIFNRWGDVVYRTENYDNDLNVWHGDNLKGTAVAEGTYFYTIEIPSLNYSTSNWVYLDLK